MPPTRDDTGSGNGRLTVCGVPAPTRMLNKVPEVTVLFWVTKLLSTAMGESTSDYLVKAINPVVAVLLGGVVLIGALAVQLRADRYIPWKYWLAVVLVAVTGTMAADVLHIQFHVPYTASTVLFAVVLVLVVIVQSVQSLGDAAVRIVNHRVPARWVWPGRRRTTGQ